MNRFHEIVAVLTIAASGCADASDQVDARACTASSECPVREVCVEQECERAWSGVGYRLVGASVSECEGEYAFAASFAGQGVAIADRWRECPASWSFEGDVMVPTPERERFTLSVQARYAGSPAASLEWEGIPEEVLHYGQWEGDVQGHRIGLWLDLVE